MDEMKKLGINEFADLLSARPRRSLKRGLKEQQKILLKKIQNKEENIETHCKDMVILPEMVGIMIKVHKGNQFAPVAITEEMIGHYIGEFVLTRNRVEHSAPGIGATRSSASLSVK